MVKEMPWNRLVLMFLLGVSIQTGYGQETAADFNTRIQFSKDIAGAFHDVAVALQAKGLEKQAGNSIAKSRDRVLDALQWTGSSGALYEVSVQKEPNTGVLALVEDPNLVGIGNRPESVLTETANKPRLRAGPRAGFQISKADSYYLWARPTRDWLYRRTLEYGVIDAVFTEQLRAKAFAASQDQEFLRRTLEYDRDRAYQSAVNKAMVDLEDQILRERIAQINQDRVRGEQDVNNTLRNLNSDLNRAAELDGLRAVITGLAGMLSVAEVGQKLSRIGYLDAPANLQGKSSAEASGYVQQLQLVLGQGIVSKRQSLDDQRMRQRATEEKLESELRGAGAPTELFPGNLR